MKHFLAALVYTGLALLANPAAADLATAAALRDGDMKKLILHEAPRPFADVALVDASGAETRLSDHQGNWLVVNFWATWCAPCRKEMPTLSRLQDAMQDAPVEVITVATGRNQPAAIDAFFDEIGVDNMPDYRDPKQMLARQSGIMGLPVTVLLDPQGNEAGRLIGDAHWDSESAIAVLRALSSGS